MADAYLDAVPFYEKNGFHKMNAEDNDPHTRASPFRSGRFARLEIAVVPVLSAVSVMLK